MTRRRQARGRRRWAWGAFALVLLFGVLGGIYVASRRSRRKTQPDLPVPAPLPTEANPRGKRRRIGQNRDSQSDKLVGDFELPLPKPEDPSGLSITGGRLQVESLDLWRIFANEATEDALRRGMRTADDVLAYVLRMALPRYPWPPRHDSSLFPQWREMLGDVKELLRFDPQPEPRQGLRVI